MIIDNWRGFDTCALITRGHSGLEHMRTRIEEIGGAMRIDSSPGQGARLGFELPLMEVYHATSATDDTNTDR